MWKLKIGGRFTRGLRFRLALSYMLFFAVLLSFMGIFFRQTLYSIYDTQAHNLLIEEWGAVKAYLKIDKGKVEWYYDPQDPDEALIVNRLKQVYLLTDANGTVLEASAQYENIGIDSPQEIKSVIALQKEKWRYVTDKHGVPFLVRSGPFIDDDHKNFYVAVGRSLAETETVLDQFTRNYFLMLPVLIVASSLLGWFVARSALRPLNDVAKTAQRITSSNLTIEIPTRGADDELDRLVHAFNRMIERLNDSFIQTRQFSTDVSHELRTPLTAIRGQLEVALLTANTVEQYRDAMVDALQDVERLSQTIRALLLLSQSESGQLNLQRQVLDLSALIADIVDQFQIPAEGAKVELTSQLPHQCLIEADRVQIERLVSNLLSNAIKYTQEGGRVSVTLQRQGDMVAFVVEDTGLGIPADHLPHIFDRFYRVPTQDRNPEKGLGLGLSFVAWIVKAHHGKIDVQSELGRGTKFTVLLPVGQVTPVEAPAQPALDSAERS
jgi:heavy metal sensor kinase